MDPLTSEIHWMARHGQLNMKSFPHTFSLPCASEGCTWQYSYSLLQVVTALLVAGPTLSLAILEQTLHPPACNQRLSECRQVAYGSFQLMHSTHGDKSSEQWQPESQKKLVQCSQLLQSSELGHIVSVMTAITIWTDGLS